MLLRFKFPNRHFRIIQKHIFLVFSKQTTILFPGEINSSMSNFISFLPASFLSFFSFPSFFFSLLPPSFFLPVPPIFFFTPPVLSLSFLFHFITTPHFSYWVGLIFLLGGFRGALLPFSPAGMPLVSIF